jgi:hypothetical protein
MSEEEQVPRLAPDLPVDPQLRAAPGAHVGRAASFLDEMMPKVGVDYRPEPIDLAQVFGRRTSSRSASAWGNPPR